MSLVREGRPAIRQETLRYIPSEQTIILGGVCRRYLGEEYGRYTMHA
jgi:hypothetical protein